MSNRATGFGTKTMNIPPSYQTAELKAAIRAVLREGDPDVADALFEPMGPTRAERERR